MQNTTSVRLIRVLHLFAIGALILTATLGLHGQSHRAKLSLDLLSFEARRTGAPARVIVKGDTSQIQELARRHGVTVVKLLEDSAVVLANSRQVFLLAEDPASEILSGDLPVAPFMSVSNGSIAADQTRSGTSGILGIGALAGVTGQGVTIAVIDSGISAHPALAQKIVANVSLVTGEPAVDDAYGHGTHIAGIIAGSNTSSTGTPLYTGGIAPGAKLVNVRVLGAKGTGWTSDVVAGIEWVIANKDRFKIRIINLSLGHPVTEPSVTDPLCRAVAKAASAGIVVIASAGNAGKAADGSPILGGISSPGNSPYAITAGAINTRGTVRRNDDVMATYSSRGPTKFELAAKPDVVAPGNKIVSLEAQGSYLQKTYDHLHVAGKNANAYMQLSGTSMSAGMVSGAAALLMNANPKISALQLKMALQAGSTYMADGGVMGGGAGSVNVWTSRKLAANGLTDLLSTVVSGVLSPASGVVFWDTGSLISRVYDGPGLRVLSLLEAPLAWLSPTLLRTGDLNIFGLTNPLASTAPNQILWGDVAGWTNNTQILWGDTIYDPQGQQILWGDSSESSDYQILWGDSTGAGDAP